MRELFVDRVNDSTSITGNKSKQMIDCLRRILDSIAQLARLAHPAKL